MRVLAIDWGKATGLAVWLDDKHDAWVSDWETALYTEVPAYVREGQLDLVVMENFLISERTTRTAVTAGWSRGKELELIGATKYMCHVYDVEHLMQTPAQAKDFCTDQKLRLIGWYTAGLDHSRDASRHLLLALVNRRVIDPAVLLDQDA